MGLQLEKELEYVNNGPRELELNKEYDSSEGLENHPQRTKIFFAITLQLT